MDSLEFETTADIDVPDRLVDQVIGQERANEVIKKAARQHRHLMMIGEPGTGKSMLAKSMTELMDSRELQDVLVYPNDDDDTKPRVRSVQAGKGQKIVSAYRQDAQKKQRSQGIIVLLVIGIILLYGFLSSASLLMTIITAAVVVFLYSYLSSDPEEQMPQLLVDNGDRETAPFEDATGAHKGALLGDVRHDPFQSGGMETPAHQRVEPGAIHRADNGVLFVDEINTLDVQSQQKLMTSIQEDEFAVTGQSERSSGAMVQTEPVPTDFIMVAAGNMDAIENMHPALRDRLQGYGYEVFMENTIEDTPEIREKFARFVAQEVHRDDGIPHFTNDAVEEVILEARRKAGERGKLTLELRELGGLVRDAGDVATEEDADVVTRDHVLNAKNLTKSIEQQYADRHIQRRNQYRHDAETDDEVGRVNGLAVMGDDSGIVLPIMSSIVDSQQEGAGQIIATGKLQDIAEEAVDNVSAVIKKAGESLVGKDIHIQFVQTYDGVQGDSASVTIATGVLSAMHDIAIRQDVAMTGSLSVRGDVLPVGGVTHKIEAAAKAGIETVIIPKANENDVFIEDEYEDQIEVVYAESLSDVLEVALVDDSSITSLR